MPQKTESANLRRASKLIPCDDVTGAAIFVSAGSAADPDTVVRELSLDKYFDSLHSPDYIYGTCDLGPDRKLAKRQRTVRGSVSFRQQVSQCDEVSKCDDVSKSDDVIKCDEVSKCDKVIKCDEVSKCNDVSKCDEVSKCDGVSVTE